MATIDLDRLSRVFLRHGERVVIIGSDGEPLVLVPLDEYESMMKAKPVKPAAEHQPKRANAAEIASPKVAPKTQAALEPVDPPQGALKDDDQYYPEPLEG